MKKFKRVQKSLRYRLCDICYMKIPNSVYISNFGLCVYCKKQVMKK